MSNDTDWRVEIAGPGFPSYDYSIKNNPVTPRSGDLVSVEGKVFVVDSIVWDLQERAVRVTVKALGSMSAL